MSQENSEQKVILDGAATKTEAHNIDSRVAVSKNDIKQQKENLTDQIESSHIRRKTLLVWSTYCWTFFETTVALQVKDNKAEAIVYSRNNRGDNIIDDASDYTVQDKKVVGYGEGEYYLHTKTISALLDIRNFASHSDKFKNRVLRNIDTIQENNDYTDLNSTLVFKAQGASSWSESIEIITKEILELHNAVE